MLLLSNGYTQYVVLVVTGNRPVLEYVSSLPLLLTPKLYGGHHVRLKVHWAASRSGVKQLWKEHFYLANLSCTKI